MRNHIFALTGMACLMITGLRLEAADVTPGLINNDILRLQVEMQRAESGRMLDLRQQAVSAIRQRASELNKLAQQDPAQALSTALSPEVVADLAGKFPEAADQLEQSGSWEGAVDPWVIDYSDGSHKTFTRLKTGDQTFEVNFAGEQPAAFKCGDRLQVTGIRVGSTMVASSSTVQPMALAEAGTAALACSTTGVQKTVVILATFPGVTPPAYITNQAVYDSFFGTSQSLDNYWREASYGKTSASGDVFGWYTLASTYACANAGSAQMTQDVINTAAAHGVVFQNYTRLFVVVPEMGCGWSGFSNMICQTMSSPAGSFLATTTYIAGSQWNNGTPAVRSITHEGGHALGLNHSNSRTFGTEPLGPVGSAGTVIEYGDPYTAMSTGQPGHYAAPHKASILGWLGSNNYQVVQGGGTFTVAPLETATAGLQALKIQRGTGNNAWIWLEYRQPIGAYDSLYLNGNTWSGQIFSGAYMHYEDSLVTNGYSNSLDFTPTSDMMYWDPALAAGQTWTDPYSDLKISIGSATSSGLSVTVSYGGGGSNTCTHANPTVTMSPANPNVNPGSSVAYTVSVKNNDSSGCLSSSFTMASTQPAGWTGSFSSSSLTINPGQTSTVTLNEVVPASAAAGTYPVGSNAANGSYTGSTAVSATVSSTTPSTLTDAVSVAGSNYSSRQTVPMTSLVLKNGAPVAGASVTFTMTKSNGSKSSSTATTDSTGRATWSYRVNQKDPAGSWTVMSSATYSSQSATSNTASFTVQ